MIDNRDSKKRYRADVLIEDQLAKYDDKTVSYTHLDVYKRQGEKTVYKGSGGLGIVHRHYEHALVEGGSKNVRLLGKVGGAADDVILPVLYLADKGRTFLVQYDVHIIAYSCLLYTSRCV